MPISLNVNIFLANRSDTADAWMIHLEQIRQNIDGKPKTKRMKSGSHT